MKQQYKRLPTSLISSRLVKWSEENDILTDAQFGFRPGFGTTDAIFALHSLISNTSKKSKRLLINISSIFSIHKTDNLG
jgi:hypothetical protein